MLESFKRFVLSRLGGVPPQEVARLRKSVERQNLRGAADLRRLAKRLDRLQLQLDRMLQGLASLDERTEAIDRTLRSGRLRKIDGNVDALVRHAFVTSNHLPEPQATLLRRFRGMSQNDEDGITLALMDRIGSSTRRFVEIGAGVNGGNSGFLARECGWTGVMVEIDPDRVRTLKRRFGPAVAVVDARVTRENINELLSSNGIRGEIDLLSLDIDGIDYWVWESLSICSPRLVIVEYNRFLGTDRAVTIPYDADFDRRRFDVPSFAYYGASLPAFVHLAGLKGYRLVAIEPRGVNAFFVRNDLAPDLPALEYQRVPVEGEDTPNFGEGGLPALLDSAGLPLVSLP